MRPDDLRVLARSLPEIEQAKGIVMGCYGHDAEAAFALLVRLSSTRNQKVRHVAELLVQTATEEPATTQMTQSACERVDLLVRGFHEDV